MKHAIHGLTLRWALYDWANTAFAMAAALMFGPIFKAVWCRDAGLPPGDINLYYNLTLSAASLLVAVCAPILAGSAESGGLRMPLLRFFALAGALLTAALGFVPAGAWGLASLVYVLAAMCFYSGNIFFDSLLVAVAAPAHRHTASGLAFSFGYAAGFVILVALGFAGGAVTPPWFFGLSGVWWALFAIPLLLHREPPVAKRTFVGMAASGLAEAKRTFLDIWAIRPLRRFLLAYIFYIDGVSTVVATAAYLGAAIGFSTGDVMKAFLIVQIFGVPCALGFGKLAEKVGPRRLIAVALVIYLGVTAYGALLRPGDLTLCGVAVSPFWILAGLVGMVQGGVQALSRSYYASLVPEGRETAFFGFYSMIGKCATVFGPLLSAAACAVVVRFVPAASGDLALLARTGFASLAVLFLLGLVFLALAAKAERQDGPARA